LPFLRAFIADVSFSIPEDEVFLTEDDFRNAELLTSSPTKSSRLLPRQSFLHGDIRGKAAWKLVTFNQIAKLGFSPYSFQKTRRKGARRNGVITGIKKWPNGRVPYMISGQYTERERALLARSFQLLQEYHKRTCIRFVPRTPLDRDYLYIGKIDGCFSDVGRAGGRQELSLDDGCMQYDTAIHELMHSVGFYHEHERWDRDNHIRILWQNIDRDAYDQFGKVDLSESSYYGQVYDYYSIMHYDSLAFSKNGLETMVARRPEMTVVIGSAIDFSPVENYLFINLLKKALVLDCTDKTNLCWRWLDRCGSFFFERIMKEFCALSCGYCIPKSKMTAPVKAAKGASASYLQLG
ncbi:shTK domain protein, partial [Ancylostoma duodenale]